MKMNGMIGSLVKMAMRAGMDALSRKSRQAPTKTSAKGGKPAAAEKKLQNAARDTAKRARQAAKITRRLGK